MNDKYLKKVYRVKLFADYNVAEVLNFQLSNSQDQRVIELVRLDYLRQVLLEEELGKLLGGLERITKWEE